MGCIDGVKRVKEMGDYQGGLKESSGLTGKELSASGSGWVGCNVEQARLVGARGKGVCLGKLPGWAGVMWYAMGASCETGCTQFLQLLRRIQC